MFECLEAHHDPNELHWDYEMILVATLFHLIQGHEEMLAVVVLTVAAAADELKWVAADHGGSSGMQFRWT
jgi:hypothetical protein